MQRFLVDINRSQSLIGMQAQLAKLTNKPFNLAEKLFGLGKEVASESVMASTNAGQMGYLQKATSILNQAFGQAISQKNVTLAQDIFRQFKNVTADLADLKKETLSTAIDKLTIQLQETTAGFRDATDKLVQAVEKAAGLTSSYEDQTRAQHIYETAQAINNTAEWASY